MSSYVFSVNNEGRLYRVDLRGPDDIFENGFESFGQNDDLKDHSKGTSCINRERNSAFISVSADPEYAANYARRLLRPGIRSVYVYIINSTHDTYNMATSLNNIGYHAGIHDAETQSEWIAHRRIQREDVIGVRAYTGSDTPSIIYNHNSSSDRRAVINNFPYTPGGNYSRPGMSNYATLTPLVTACMSATIYCSRQSYGITDSCPYVEKLNPKKFVLWDD